MNLLLAALFFVYISTTCSLLIFRFVPAKFLSPLVRDNKLTNKDIILSYVILLSFVALVVLIGFNFDVPTIPASTALKYGCVYLVIHFSFMLFVFLILQLSKLFKNE